MLEEIDYRSGKELGLAEAYWHKAAFEIVNDAHDHVGALTSRLMTFKYAQHGSFGENAFQYALANAKRIEFSRRLGLLAGNSVKAAELTDELVRFVETAVDPWLAEIERSTSVEP